MGYGLLILFLAAAALVVVVGTGIVAWRLTHPARLTPGNMIAQGMPTDPAEAGAPFETHVLDAADGTPIELWLVKGESQEDGERDERPVMLMLHGWGGGRLDALLWLDVLRSAASCVVLFDQRGHGESAHRICTWGIREREDAARVAQHLRELFPERPLVLLGLSMGAAIAIDAARDCSAAAVIADSPYRDPVEVVRNTLRLNQLPAWPFVELAFAVLAGRWPQLLRMDVARHAGRMHCPLHIVHGEEDRVAPIRGAQTIAEAAPNAQLHVFPSCDHLQQAREDPQRYRMIIEHCARTIEAV